MENQNVYDLEKIGLTRGEAKTYVALSEIGTSTVGPIVNKSGVAYSKIYEVLNRLIKKGIVSFIIKDKTKYFQAVSPKNLLEYILKKKNEILNQEKTLLEIIPQLENIQKITSKLDAEVFVGNKGLKTAYEKFLIKEKNTEFLFFYIHKERYAKKADLFYYGILNLWSKVPSRGITNELSKKSGPFKDVKNLELKYVDFPIPGNIEVCNNKVLLISWGETLISILIHSEDIANNYRKYFNTVWKKAKNHS